MSEVSTWTWTGETDNTWGNSGNWSPSVGSPQSGDTAILNSAMTPNVLTLTGTELSNNIIDLSNGAVVDFANGSSLDGSSTVIAVNGSFGTIDVTDGTFTDYGSIGVYSGNTLVVSMASGATLLSNGPTMAGPGTDVGINAGDAGEFNGGTLFVLGGTLENQEVHVNGGSIELTSALTSNDELSIDGGELQIDQQSTISPNQITFINSNTSIPSILKFDNPGMFDGDGAGMIIAFMTGDTLDIGAESVGTIIYNVDTTYGIGTLTVENTSGSTLFTAQLSGGDAANFETGTFALSGTQAGSFLVANNGVDTQISEASGTVSVSPSVTISAGGTASYLAGGIGIALDSGVVVSDPGSSTLNGATVAITSGFLAGDILNVGSAQAGISSSYNPSTGVLTLTGSASLAAYQAELDSVTYTFSPSDPTGGGADTSRTITWTANDGTTTASATSSLTVSFGSEPSNDIMFQNTDGQVAVWQVNGGLTLTAYGVIGPNPGPSWTMVGTGAFYTGDTSDILWQNVNGQAAVWQVQGTSLISYGTLGANPGTSWHVVGTGNFYTTDSNTDILWQNDDGEVGIWDVNGSRLVNYAAVIANPGTTWHVEGTGNFYGTGDNTILFQNDNGQVGMWEMDGSTISQLGVVGPNPGSSWMIKGTGDFYGNGQTDILWQNTDGEVGLWEMTNGPTIEQTAVIANPGTAWHVVGTGDFNNDGKTDIVFQSTGGQVGIWEMNGSTITALGAMASPGTSWSVVDNTMRFIYSQGAGETLAATPAVADEFVFTSYAAGSHTITGFDPMQDVVAFSSSQFANFGAVEAATSAVAAGAMINLGQGSSLLLAGVDPSTLRAGNFALS